MGNSIDMLSNDADTTFVFLQLLETVRNALLHVSTLLPGNTTISLEALNNEFQNLRKLAANILDDIECVPEMLVIPVDDFVVH